MLDIDLKSRQSTDHSSRQLRDDRSLGGARISQLCHRLDWTARTEIRQSGLQHRASWSGPRWRHLRRLRPCGLMWPAEWGLNDDH